jgi:hypothetical protein
MGISLITLASFRDLHEALLAQGKLQSAGIECLLADDNVIRMDWLYANAIGGVKLRVREQDAAAARELLDAPMPALLMDDTDGEIYQQPQCPSCGSFEIGYGERKGAKILSWLVLGFPLPIPGRRRWKCEDCGAEWVEVPEETGQR